MTAGDQTSAGTEPGPAPPALLPGDPRRIGDIRLLGRLGEGGMGTVYLGQTPTGKLVAVKVIRADYARDERFRARFRAEADAARRVARFCTAQVLDAGTDGDLAYLVTEYISGPTLAVVVAQEGPLHGSMLDSLAIGVAAALNGIHAAGVIHRDLKPSNVLLSRVGPKVIDFGIARALDALESLTDSGQAVGTPAYMAPEQFEGATTTATDIFSWGSVVTFAGTGRAPFGSGTPYELMRRVTSGEPDLDGLDEPMRALVARALDKRPEARPSARALLLALVGDREDPVGASSRILSSSWEPAAATLVDLPPTRLDSHLADSAPGVPDAEPPQTKPQPEARPQPEPRPQFRRLSRWLNRLVGVLVAVAVIIVLAVIVVHNLPDRNNGAGPNTSPSVVRSSAAATAGGQVTGSPAAQIPATQDGIRTVAIGDRVPATGVATLKVGQIDRFRFRLTSARVIYLKGYDCTNLVPYTLSKVDGTRVTEHSFGCQTDGPLSLAAGEYELRVGAGGADGKYAFQLIGG